MVFFHLHLDLRVCLHRGPAGETWSGDFERQVQRRLWKRSISFYRGSIRGTERYLEREGSSNMFIGPELYLIYFSVTYNLEDLWHYVGPQHSKRVFDFLEGTKGLL